MKTVREIAVPLKNEPGALAAISDLLGAAGVNILALNVRAEGDTGTLNFLVPDPERVVGILESAGMKPTINEIIAAEAPHHPGGLNALLKPLQRANVNVEYLYSCIGTQPCSGETIILLGVDNLAAAHDALAKEWIRLYGEEVYKF
jgi:hypothetical protein